MGEIELKTVNIDNSSKNDHFQVEERNGSKLARK